MSWPLPALQNYHNLSSCPELRLLHFFQESRGSSSWLASPSCTSFEYKTILSVGNVLSLFLSLHLLYLKTQSGRRHVPLFFQKIQNYLKSYHVQPFAFSAYLKMFEWGLHGRSRAPAPLSHTTKPDTLLTSPPPSLLVEIPEETPACPAPLPALRNYIRQQLCASPPLPLCLSKKLYCGSR
jgi:hypothetical protein